MDNSSELYFASELQALQCFALWINQASADKETFEDKILQTPIRKGDYTVHMTLYILSSNCNVGDTVLGFKMWSIFSGGAVTANSLYNFA